MTTGSAPISPWITSACLRATRSSGLATLAAIALVASLVPSVPLPSDPYSSIARFRALESVHASISTSFWMILLSSSNCWTFFMASSMSSESDAGRRVFWSATFCALTTSMGLPDLSDESFIKPSGSAMTSARALSSALRIATDTSWWSLAYAVRPIRTVGSKYVEESALAPSCRTLTRPSLASCVSCPPLTTVASTPPEASVDKPSGSEALTGTMSSKVSPASASTRTRYICGVAPRM